MKTRRAIFTILGSLFILVNILVDLTNPDRPPKADDAYGIGYFIGAHFLIILGLIFLGLAFNIHKKIKRQRGSELEKDINEMGKQ